MAGIEVESEGECKIPRGSGNFREGYFYGLKLERTVLLEPTSCPGAFDQLGPKVDINEGSSQAKGEQGSYWIFRWIGPVFVVIVPSIRSLLCTVQLHGQCIAGKMEKEQD
jgi:hypothetical protein